MKKDSVQRPRILYVEDDPKSRLIIRKLLESAGCIVYEAVNGKEGVEKAATLIPDVILMDIMLPVMDGLEATRRIREIKETAKIPIIALTAKAMAGDREQILQAGCDDYIAKPIDIPLLLHKLLQIIGTELSLQPHESLQKKERITPAALSETLLIVDDTPKNVIVLEKVFTSEGYNVLTASNGMKALEILKNHQIDLVISDIAMPVMDGYRLCYEMMKNPKTRGIHFIFYSSHYSNKREVGFGLTLGADHYMVRPLETKKLVTRVKNVLQHEKKLAPLMSWEEFSQLHDELLTSKIIEIAPKTESFKEVETDIAVEMGRSYLVEEKTPEKSYTIFLKKLSEGFQGLVLTRTYPKFVKNRYNLEETPFVWLSATASKEFTSTTDLTELSLSIKHFISTAQKSVILLDGYEFLASKMGFTVMLHFLQSLNEFVSSHNCMLLIPVDPKTLTQKELRTLERELIPLL